MQGMANIEKYPYRRIIQLDNATKDAVRAYRFKHDVLSDAEVIRSILVDGLVKDGVLKRDQSESKRAARR